ncbi:MAG: hypothetical protein AAB658_14380, partial [Chloroflexota bacterium]
KWAPFLIVLGALSLFSLITLALSTTPETAPLTSMSKVSQAQIDGLENTWGIRLTNVAVTANGGVIDLRYQVVDPDKAIGILDEEDFPILIDEASGQVLSKGIGHGGHNSNSFKAGRTYFMLYQNYGHLLDPGSRITVKVGPVVVEHVIVR